MTVYVKTFNGTSNASEDRRPTKSRKQLKEKEKSKRTKMYRVSKKSTERREEQK